MNINSRIVQLLLRLYPNEWRAEYGEELASLLLLRPVTPPVLVAVIRSAVRERFKGSLSKACGAGLLVWTVLGIFINNAMRLSYENYERYVHSWEMVVLLTGCLTFLSNPRESAAWAATKAALIGYIPEMIALTLWATRLFHPLVTQAVGPFPLLESRLALFDMTFPTAPQPDIGMVPLSIASVVAHACVFGFLGGLVGRAISFLSPRLRRR